MSAIISIRKGQDLSLSRTCDFKMRPEQLDAVNKTMALHINTSAPLVRVIGRIGNRHYFGFEIIRKLP